ncbi:hypothetical protein D9M72_311220 [compost metagenome]
MTTKQPPISEIDFLRACYNHNELCRKLESWEVSPGDLPSYARFVCVAWMKLGEEHLVEANAAHQTGSIRSTYSRAYYAVYNASKAIRYIHRGLVSLKGDDHSKASVDLPDNLPDQARWARVIVSMLENRHRADYDNWVDTAASFTMTPEATLNEANQFIAAAWLYLTTEYQLKK